MEFIVNVFDWESMIAKSGASLYRPPLALTAQCGWCRDNTDADHCSECGGCLKCCPNGDHECQQAARAAAMKASLKASKGDEG
jgi:hypothetical protein